GPVFRVRLHVFAEDVAGDGGDDLVGRDRAEAADRVAAHREAAHGPQVWVLGLPQRQRVIDADAEEVLAVRLHHVVEDGDDAARPYGPTAETGGAVVNPGDLVDLLLAVDAEHSIAERRFDLPRQVVARRGHRVVHPLEHSERRAVLQRFDDVPSREWAED